MRTAPDDDGSGGRGDRAGGTGTTSRRWSGMNGAKIREDIARIEGEMDQLKAMVKHNIGDQGLVTDCNDKLRQLHSRLVELQKELQRATLRPRS